MTDKELLELAAKAAGIKGEWDGTVYQVGTPFRGSLAMMNYEEWNPLTDDGDALRLAVKITLEIDICRTGIAVRTPDGIKVLVDEKEESDPYAATRRAIVRAAAEIGKGMK